MRWRVWSLLAITVLLAAPASAQKPAAFDAAAAFGARPSAESFSLSPDGTQVAYIAPAKGQGNILYTVGLEKGAKPRPALVATGIDNRLSHCSWVTNERLICRYHGVRRSALFQGPVPWNRLLAVNTDGSNVKVLSKERNDYTHSYITLGGGDILDWLPEGKGSVLMARVYTPDDSTGRRFGSTELGYGVDQIDSYTGDVTRIERPDIDTLRFFTDGYGTVRIKAVRTAASGTQKSVTRYYYRQRNSRDWLPLGEYVPGQEATFRPVAVDRDLNVAYGMKRKDGRDALYTMKLEDGLQEELIYSRSDVDVDGVVRIGRRQRVVGVTFATDHRQAEYFSPDLKGLIAALHKALPNTAITVIDASTDESRLLIHTGSDRDPGVTYIFDRKTNNLATFLVSRDPLEGVTLASMTPVSYAGTDGVKIPAYITFPPGRENAKGLPAIVLPHGGPSARDEWGFDWVAQFFANRGYVVLQPNFRGSSGYGEDWFQDNGFRSWRVAIDDILAGGHWLVQQGYADPAKLAIFGWSYGGYAALQSQVREPGTFKAVIAVAPVTDLRALKTEYGNSRRIADFIGDGPHLDEGSPIEHTDKIKVPVLLFHGGMDVNVSIEESRSMAARLKSAGGRCELVTWDELDHQLEDSEARKQMLSRSEAFLRTALGGSN